LFLFKKLIPNNKGSIRVLLAMILFTVALTSIGRDYIGESLIFFVILGAFIASGDF
jgi:hypothetical protein